MASTKKPQPPNDLPAQVESVLRRHGAGGRRLALALSGGLDSVVLLDVLCSLRADLSFELSAFHVNHGISPNADDWADFCRGLCHAYNVPLQVMTVAVAHLPGTSLEAQAREARYQALATCGADWVVTAHHQNDQAETLLLQLLRGAGVKGMAGMAGEGLLPGASMRLLRPLLTVSRERLARHAADRGLQWVEDESNERRRHDRNYLRHEILPRLVERFPGCLETLGRSAAHLAEAQKLLDERAREDEAVAVVDGRLQVVALAGLSSSRACNLLRHFLASQGLLLPSERRLLDMLSQLTGARPDARLRICHDGAELRRFAGQVYVVKPQPCAHGQAVSWQGQARLPWQGRSVCFAEGLGKGISLEKSLALGLSLRLRQGGERLRLAGNRPPRSLKNLFQEAGLPPWERESLPLVYCGDSLVCVPGVGVDWNWRATAGEAGLLIEMDR